MGAGGPGALGVQVKWTNWTYRGRLEERGRGGRGGGREEEREKKRENFKVIHVRKGLVRMCGQNRECNRAEYNKNTL